MTIQTLMKRAIKLIKNKQFFMISERFVEVTDNKKKYEVLYITKPGRTIQTCSCSNSAKHCKQPIRCVHRIVAEWVLMLHQLNKKREK